MRGCTWYGRPALVRRCAQPSRRIFGTSRSLRCVDGRAYLAPSRNATNPGRTWGVGHGSGKAFGSLDDGSSAADPGPGHEPNNRIIRPAGLGRGTAELIAPVHLAASQIALGSSGSDLPFPARCRRNPGLVGRWGRRAPRAPIRRRRQAVRPLPDELTGGRSCRTTPLTSRSSRTTRAAATRSGSRVIVVASQSMYDGSKAATWPSV